MRTVLRLAAFEIRQQTRQLSTWVWFGVFFALAFFLTASAAGAWPDFDTGSTVLLADSPSRISSTLLILSILALPLVAGIAGRAVLRDFETRAHPLFFTTPVPKWAYVGGRWLGSVAALAIIFLALPLGLGAGAAFPGNDPDRVGGFGAAAYAVPFLVIVLPNLVSSSALFLIAAALARRALAAQVAAVGLLLGWAISRLFVTALDFDWFTQLSDPFGGAPLSWSQRYWTVHEQNTAAIPLSDPLLANRALWLAVGFAVLAYGTARFRFRHFAPGEGGRGPAPGEEAPSLAAVLRLPTPRRAFGAGARWLQFRTLARQATRRILRGPWFWILAGMSLFFILVNGAEIGSIYGTRTYPVTYQVLELLGPMFGLFVMIIIAIYAGELVWEDREAGTAQVADALPVPGWIPFAASTAALVAMAAVLLALTMASGMLIQAARGWVEFQPGLYLRELFGLWLPGVSLFVVLAMTVQTLVDHKYAGHFVFLLYFIASPLLYTLGAEHNLFHYGSTPETFYSDMNGYGHTLRPWGWYQLFWSGVAVLLAVLSTLFRVRGAESGPRWRVRLARRRATRPILAASAVAAALVLGTGAFIVHNTVGLNEWTTSDAAERFQAEYEIRYKRYEHRPQPRISAVALDVDIFPEARDARMRGTYRLVNRAAVPIDTVFVDLPSDLRIRRMDVAGAAARVIADADRGFYAFRLARPLAPGDSTVLRFDVAHVTRGFADEPSFFPVVENGTFFTNQMLPSIGYNPDGELADEGARAKHGLGERPRAAPIDDPRGLARNDLSRDADWIRFRATVSTSADQAAIAPGRLARTWRRGDRRYFDYRMDVPMLNFYSFLSARYAVARDEWNGVEIEVFHHAGHPYNVPRMIGAVKASLAYYTREFGPYQHGHVRIVEFPRYGDFAQSFAGTIPYSEGIGFIADVTADDIDYPFFVTAHEVAHQWWGHQAVPAHVQGSAMLSETLSEYAALMVMEQEFGRDDIGRFLRYELDQYLQGRGTERRREMPLSLVEYQQYIHYNKGALAMYALRDYAGEVAVNGALRAFLEEARYGGAPYPTSRDLVRHLRAALPDSLHPLVTDLFETVTLWDLRAVRAEGTAREDGRYEVEFTVDAEKVRADGLGRETPVEIDDVIDVAVLDAEGEPLWQRRARFTGAPRTFRAVLDEWPRTAAIDPRHVLIDRALEDNEVAIVRRREGGR